MRLRSACGLYADSIAADPARRSCARLREVESGFRCTPTTCFETFPFPRPTWLAHAHSALDAAVFAACGWPADLTDAEILARLLALNLERPPTQANPPSTPRIPKSPDANHRGIRQLACGGPAWS